MKVGVFFQLLTYRYSSFILICFVFSKIILWIILCSVDTQVDTNMLNLVLDYHLLFIEHLEQEDGVLILPVGDIIKNESSSH